MSTAVASPLPSFAPSANPSSSRSTGFDGSAPSHAHQVPRSTLAARLEARFALRATAMLDERALGHDIEQRLRVAREQAVTRARLQRRGASSAARSSGVSGPFVRWLHSPWGLRVAGSIPFALLVAGLIGIAHVDQHERATAAAELDSGLLSDELPPDAYADPAFAAFLQQPRP